jgi:protein-S-isoprenylcysteine O-methyltransferase Ste14
MRKFLSATRSIQDGILYLFIGPFNVLFIIPQFLLEVEKRLGIIPFHIPAGDITGRYLTWLGAALAIYCTLLMKIQGKGTPLVKEPPKKIMDKNIYGIVRNPMMWSLILVLLGEIIWFGSALLIIWFFAWLRIGYLIIKDYEEPQLAQRFGEEWFQYCKRVPRWIPKIR